MKNKAIASAVGHLLVLHKKTLALAESCTGGLIAHKITQSAGASRYFKGAVVAYDDRIKEVLLGISAMSLKRHGAVSPQVARGMARQARLKFKTDLGVGVTGIAGPGGGSVKKPVGLIYIAVSDKKRTKVFKNLLAGTRSDIQEKAATQALRYLRDWLLTSEPWIK